MNNRLQQVLSKSRTQFHPVVEFDRSHQRLVALDFTSNNAALSPELVNSTAGFSKYIFHQLAAANAIYGIGGYDEDRVLYQRSAHFDAAIPRSVHLGIDIWGAEGTKVFAPVGGMVHSFAYNDRFGDYGATIILQHQLETVVFHTLYGHLSLKDLIQMQEGKYISRGELIGHFGNEEENGNWPPHLHFQIIEDMRINVGDYPGVCSINEREKYLANCPDPDLILNMMQYV